MATFARFGGDLSIKKLSQIPCGQNRGIHEKFRHGEACDVEMHSFGRPNVELAQFAHAALCPLVTER